MAGTGLGGTSAGNGGRGTPASWRYRHSNVRTPIGSHQACSDFPALINLVDLMTKLGASAGKSPKAGHTHKYTSFKSDLFIMDCFNQHSQKRRYYKVTGVLPSKGASLVPSVKEYYFVNPLQFDAASNYNLFFLQNFHFIL